MKRVGIIDYGMGNLHSVEKALQKGGAETRVVADPDQVKNCERLVVPGVGAFGDAVANLQKTFLWDAVKDYFLSGRPVLGICLGMQILLEGSCEKGEHKGFGFIPGQVVRFPDTQKVPQIGWNQVEQTGTSPLFAGIPDRSYFYLVHSYYAAPRDTRDVIALSDYGIRYATAVARGNVFGVQFHPEKSQKWGLKLLENFLSI